MSETSHLPTREPDDGAGATATGPATDMRPTEKRPTDRPAIARPAVDQPVRDQLVLPGGNDRLLLHSCCAPCSGEPMEAMLDSGIDFTIFFYNPNIHPQKEY